MLTIFTLLTMGLAMGLGPAMLRRPEPQRIARRRS